MADLTETPGRGVKPLVLSAVEWNDACAHKRPTHVSQHRLVSEVEAQHAELSRLRLALADMTTELQAVMGEVQRLQPMGSPPPGGSRTLAMWIIGVAQMRLSRMEAFLEQSGYRRCDIPACNCESFHGGMANERLREISDSLQEAGLNGGTVHGGVLEFIRRAEAAEAALGARERENATLKAFVEKVADCAIDAWEIADMEAEARELLDTLSGGAEPIP